MSPLIGEFEVDPSAIVDTPLPPKGENTVILIDKAERRVAPESGNSYITMQISFPDTPGYKIFHSYFLTPAALGARTSAISWKKFLDKTGLPYTTQAQELVNQRFVVLLRHKGKDDEAEAVIDKIIGKA